MRAQQYFLVGLVSALMVTLTGRTSAAFSLVPAQPGATSNWRPVSPYFVQDDFGNRFGGQTEVDTRLWTERIPLEGTPIFNVTFNLWAAQSTRGILGWDFRLPQQELMGSFEIVNYLACGYRVLCGAENPGAPDVRDEGVGATFYLRYHPAPTDPKPGQQGRQLHWVQVVRANYGVGAPGGPLLPGLPFIDNEGRRNDPYYDNTGIAGEDFFQDRPYNPGQIAALTGNYFEAELYLVEETTPPGRFRREVTIYNGIKWGWSNKVAPLAPDPCSGGSGGGGCRTVASANSFANRELPLSDFDSGDLNQSPERVPEPTTVLGLLALGSWSITQILKNQKSKRQ